MKRFTPWLCALLVACGAESESAQLECSDAGVENERLIVVCNRDVTPVPEACERTAPARYSCNWLHANAEQCAAFPGVCK